MSNLGVVGVAIDTKVMNVSEIFNCVPKKLDIEIGHLALINYAKNRRDLSIKEVLFEINQNEAAIFSIQGVTKIDEIPTSAIVQVYQKNPFKLVTELVSDISGFFKIRHLNPSAVYTLIFFDKDNERCAEIVDFVIPVLEV